MASVFSQQLDYQVSFPNIAHHEARIAFTVTGASEKTLTFRMSRSSPGRYATHEYGKNVYDVRAYDKSGRALPVLRTDGDVWQVAHPGSFTKLEYTLFADHPDGTYAGIDPASIHLNMPATFMWVKTLEKAPISVTFSLPEAKRWTIATQLKPGQQPGSFTAPHLQYFMDSPVKIGQLVYKRWSQTNPDKKSQELILALEAKTSDSLAGTFAGKVKKITAEAQAVFGELPDFDHGQYVFLASINPWVRGDGMEHRNSTMISLPSQFDAGDQLLGVFSHEFFHAWNVERIRPATLEPFNYEKSNMSYELWFAEGFTQYYGTLLMERAGFVSEESYCRTLSSLINTKENSAGARRISPAEASCHAVFVDAGVAVDKTNYPSIFTSYYTYGAAVALALDLELRSRKLSLDDYMKAVWKVHGRTEKPYTINDLRQVLATYATSKEFADQFFAKYITGHERFNYAPLLAKAGLKLEKQFPGEVWIGDGRYKETVAGLEITSGTITGSPLYDAGLDAGDQMVRIDGRPVKTENDLKAILTSLKSGAKVTVDYLHREDPAQASLTVVENPKWIVLPDNKAVTDEVRRFRADWWGSKVR